MKNKLTRNNKFITILLHLRRKKMGYPKNMSSYQRLKWEMDDLKADLIQTKAIIARMQSALWAIAEMKGADVVKAPSIALTALRPNEKE